MDMDKLDKIIAANQEIETSLDKLIKEVKSLNEKFILTYGE